MPGRVPDRATLSGGAPCRTRSGGERHRRPEPSLLSALLAAYEEVAPLTPAERRALCVLVEVKAARTPMRMLRHVVKAGRDERPSLVGRLARDG